MLMAKITKEEVIKIARMSALELPEHEIEPMMQRLEEVLTYAECVKQVAAEHEELQSNAAVNVFREDTVIPVDYRAILKRAPEQQDNFFVVPSIIDSSTSSES